MLILLPPAPDATDTNGSDRPNNDDGNDDSQYVIREFGGHMIFP